MRKLLVTTLCGCGLLFTGHVKAEESYLIWSRLDENFAARHLVQLALEKTEKEYGKAVVKNASKMEQARGFKELKKGKTIDIMSGAVNAEREKDYLPIRIPVQKGLLGYRVCLIKEGSEKKFEGIKSLEDWKARKISIGQGTHWPDTTILKASGFQVMTSPRYESLFSMLKKERFDCFARAASEVSNELKKYGKEMGLVLEKKLALVYRMPDFLWVNKNNSKLQERLLKGAEIAIADGSYGKVVDRLYADALKFLSGRTLIAIENPGLSQETKTLEGRKEFWIKL